MLVGIVPGFVAMLGFQRQCFALVTAREVIFTRWVLFRASTGLEETLRLERPVQLALTEEPKKNHNLGNRVELPPEVARFLGKDAVYVQLGHVRIRRSVSLGRPAA